MVVIVLDGDQREPKRCVADFKQAETSQAGCCGYQRAKRAGSLSRVPRWQVGQTRASAASRIARHNARHLPFTQTAKTVRSGKASQKCRVHQRLFGLRTSPTCGLCTTAWTAPRPGPRLAVRPYQHPLWRTNLLLPLSTERAICSLTCRPVSYTHLTLPTNREV